MKQHWDLLHLKKNFQKRIENKHVIFTIPY